MAFSSAFLLFAILYVLTASEGVVLDGKYCRKQDDGMSRCVDPPLMIEDEDLWCPYHVCGPSYIPAPECPPGDEQATHKCSEKTLNEPIHRCIPGRIHKIVNLPPKCEETDSCTGETRACACEQYTPERIVLDPVQSIKPICEE